MTTLTEDRAMKALKYLAETDESCAELKADLARKEAKIKSTESTVFLHGTGTVAERNAQADVHESTLVANEEYFKAIRAYNAVANKRSTESILIEAWRSVNSSRKKGNIV